MNETVLKLLVNTLAHAGSYFGDRAFDEFVCFVSGRTADELLDDVMCSTAHALAEHVRAPQRLLLALN